MPQFRLQANVHQNVVELRRALGSIADPLSRQKLADVISERHPQRRGNPTTVERWEAGGEPDIWSTKIMAELAGVTFEEFALGTAGLASDDVIDTARKLTDEEVARAERQDAELRAQQRSQSTKRWPGGKAG